MKRPYFFLCFTKNFLHSLRIIIRSNLFYLNSMRICKNFFLYHGKITLYYILLFINHKWFYFYFSFFCVLARTNPTILLNVMLQPLVLALALFKCLTLFIFFTPSRKSNMNNSFEIIIINIIEINIIKVLISISSLKNVTILEFTWSRSIS